MQLFIANISKFSCINISSGTAGFPTVVLQTDVICHLTVDCKFDAY